jgi:hypothetical protein
MQTLTVLKREISDPLCGEWTLELLNRDQGARVHPGLNEFVHTRPAADL